MSLFGKILAVFNVLAAIAFLVLAGMDYSKRQNWSHSYFRHQVAIHGLPVVDSDDSWRLPGLSIADNLGRKSVDELFQSVGGNGVKTQLQAIEQIKQQVEGEVNGAGDDGARRAVITRYLVPLARTGEEREKYQQLLRDPGQSTDTLRDQLLGLIGLATSEADMTGARRDLESRRRAIADVLYNISPDAGWHARVQTVVGLQHYTGAADRQAANLQQMTARLGTAIRDEQATFVRDYQSVIPQLQLLQEQVKDIDAQLKEQQDLLQKHTVLKNARQTEVAEYQRKIEDARAKAAAEMATLQGLQRQLFAMQQEIAVAQAKNQELERALRTSETGR